MIFNYSYMQINLKVILINFSQSTLRLGICFSFSNIFRMNNIHDWNLAQWIQQSILNWSGSTNRFDWLLVDVCDARSIKKI